MLDYLVGLLLAVIVCVGLGVIVYFISNKDKANTQERVNSLTEEQKRILTTTPYELVENLPHAAKVQGLIHEIPNVTNSKAKLVVLYYNMYFPNMMKQILSVNISVPYDVFTQYNLKPGDYVKIILNEDKTPKIVFN